MKDFLFECVDVDAIVILGQFTMEPPAVSKWPTEPYKVYKY